MITNVCQYSNFLPFSTEIYNFKTNFLTITIKSVKFWLLIYICNTLIPMFLADISYDYQYNTTCPFGSNSFTTAAKGGIALLYFLTVVL